jgi:protein TonB
MTALTPMSASVQKPTPISQPAPAYSVDIRAAGIEGVVVVGFTISKSGDVVNPVVVSTTERALDKATIAAVKKWKFAPATDNGVPVSVSAVQTVAFTIAELHSGAAPRAVVSKPASSAASRKS